MSILAAIVGFIITLILLRKKGGVGRHICAFVLGMVISLIPTVMWAAKLPPGWNSERVGSVWLIAIGVGLVLQILAMLIAMFLRRRATNIA
jgi:hypothetical protein